ncbi:MAG: hypothetical protein CVV25_04360 [Ignavibacteriae bacterium HGW-Ignavibacteriae-4]|jgi:hypothetical protein|nr:MAG: hypothetical protein CVV25_04360 [Ignavibacteriae bacterium HGW-Ignavibacteriae-4]
MKNSIIILLIICTCGCNYDVGEIKFGCDCANKLIPQKIQLILFDFNKYNLEYEIFTKSKIDGKLTENSKKYLEENFSSKYHTRTYSSLLLNKDDIVIDIKEYLKINISYANKCEVIFISPEVIGNKINFKVDYKLKHFD